MFNLRQNTCPTCGCYIWAHPLEKICVLTVEQAQAAYDESIRKNREVSK